MHTIKQISSLQNPVIKNIVLLSTKARERNEQQRFVAEGLRETALALKNGYQAEALFFDEKHTATGLIENLLSLRHPTRSTPELISVSTAVFEKIAYRSGVPNVIGVFIYKNLSLDSLNLPEKPLILIMENVEKPGNLGAILRTADAADASAVLVCDPQTDVFNPNAIRASLGAVFTVPVIALSPEDAVLWLRKNQVRIFATWLEASRPLYECDLTQPLAFVVGAEATGISRFWVEQADEQVIIPMAGQVDSLNVSASAAIILFETVRQRSLKTNKA